VRGGAALLRGTVTLYLSLIVVLPLTAVVWRASRDGWAAFWDAATQPQALAALRLSFAVSLLVAAGNVVMGTVIAWVLVRDEFRASGSSTPSSTCPSPCRRSLPGSPCWPCTAPAARSGSTSATAGPGSCSPWPS